MLTEENDIPLASLPVDAFKAHLRLGTGFASDVVQDEVLESFLRAAIAAVEGRTSKMLIVRDFAWRIAMWRNQTGQALPVGPVTAINQVLRVASDGGETVLDAGLFRLIPDLHAPVLAPTAALLPDVPLGGAMTVRFTAGFGPAWGDVPADLRQAVMLLAAHYYEFRGATDLGDGCMPFGVAALLSRYRNLRVGAVQ